MKIKKVIIYLLLAIFLVVSPGNSGSFILKNKKAEAASWGNGYTYRKQITADNSKVIGRSNFSNFPVLVSFVDNDLKATSSDGKIYNSNGYDIVFMSDVSTSTVLNFEIEKYSSSTGELVAWVELPILYSGADTNFYIYYGNSTATSSRENISGVWDNNYKSVWHLNDYNLNDSTGNNDSGTANGDMLSTGLVSGKMGDSFSFDGNDDYLNFASTSLSNLATAVTVELWATGTAQDMLFNTERVGSGINNLSMQVVGDKIYYAWTEDNINQYIWTGEMNVNGSNFSSTRRVSSSSPRDGLDFQVVGDKIYYVWSEKSGEYKQIWTGEMNVDGTGWTAVKRTNSTLDKSAPQLQVVGDKIYYVFYDNPTGTTSDIWTATMDIVDSSWLATNRTNDSVDRRMANPKMQVSGSSIYYAWSEYDSHSAHYQIVTGKMSIDGSSFSKSVKTSSNTVDFSQVELVVDSGKIYYTWVENDYFSATGSTTQLWIGSQGTDDRNWIGTKKTDGDSHWNYKPSLQIVGEQIFYTWYEKDISDNYKMKIASSLKDGSSWDADSINSGNQLDAISQVIGGRRYYSMISPNRDNIIVATENSNLVNIGDFYGIGVVSSTVNSFINIGVSNMRYKAVASTNLSGIITTSSMTNNGWDYIVLTYDKASLNIYLNGALISSKSFSDDIITSDLDLIIGDGWNGKIDEVRVSSNARSADWITTVYNNQNSVNTFYSVNSSEKENFIPEVSSVSINNGTDAVNLIEGTTTAITCMANISDGNGIADITTVEAKLYRSGVGDRASDNNNSHYTLSGDRSVYCTGDGSFGSCTFVFDVYYYAEPTDTGAYRAEDWVCRVVPFDSDGAGVLSTYTTEINTLYSLDVTNIDYGVINPNSTSVGDNISTITNTGNMEIDIKLSGDIINCDRGSISVSNQEYKLSSFEYGRGIDLTDTFSDLNVILPKPDSRNSNINDLLYWQVGTYAGLAGSCSSTVNIIAIPAIVDGS